MPILLQFKTFLAARGEQIYARWLIFFLIGAFAPAAVVAALNAVVDPFHLIHQGRIYVTDRNFQRYVNAGMIRTEPPFEAAVVGSSYIANFDADLIERLFGQKTRVISVYGAGFKETVPTLAYLLKKRKIKTVFFDVPVYGWCEYRDHPTWKFPAGLYQDNPLSTLVYLLKGETTRLSLDILEFGWGFKGDLPLSYRWQEVVRWYEQLEHRFDPKLLAPQIGKDMNFSMAPIVHSASEIEKLASEYAACLHRNIWPVIESYPETQFYLLNPPVLQQLLRYRTLLGQVPVWTRAQEIIAVELQQLGNARYFDFYAAGSIESDCRKFLDTAHFDLPSTDQLLTWMKKGQYERTSTTNSEVSAAVAEVASARVECPPKDD
jgi:hypothetical protein